MNSEAADQSRRRKRAGFETVGKDLYWATTSGFDIELGLSLYTDASDGPQPTEEPFVSNPDSLVAACSLFVLAQAAS